MGYGETEAKDYQQMAKHPEVVQMVIDNAIANGDVVTKASVMREIKFYKNRIAKLQEEQKKEVEVPPADYEDLKKKNASYEKENKMLLAAKHGASEEIKKLKTQIADLESRQDIEEVQKKLEADAGYFAIRTLDYIQQNGGYVWITERFEDLHGESRKQFIDAIYAIDAFAKQMVQNIGGYGIE